MRRRGRSALLAVAVVAGACTTPVSTEDFQAASLSNGRIAFVALVPKAGGFRLDPEAAETGARIVTARLLEQLDSRADLEVVPPPAAGRALRAAELAWPGADPAQVGELLGRTFGVAGFLAGEVTRYRDRVGSARGATRPASVAFEIGLYTSSGKRLWRAEFQETQRGLSDDPGSFRRAWARGFRWLTAEQLAAYGAREAIERVPGPAPGP